MAINVLARSIHSFPHHSCTNVDVVCDGKAQSTYFYNLFEFNVDRAPPFFNRNGTILRPKFQRKPKCLVSFCCVVNYDYYLHEYHSI